MSELGSIHSNGISDHFVVNERPFDHAAPPPSQPYQRYAQHQYEDAGNTFNALMQGSDGQRPRPAVGSGLGGASDGYHDQLPSYQEAAHHPLLEAGPPRVAAQPMQEGRTAAPQERTGASGSEAATQPQAEQSAPPSYFSAAAPGAAAQAATRPHVEQALPPNYAGATAPGAAARAAMRAQVGQPQPATGNQNMALAAARAAMSAQTEQTPAVRRATQHS